jgi:hypothetical protein
LFSVTKIKEKERTRAKKNYPEIKIIWEHEVICSAIPLRDLCIGSLFEK